MQSTLKLSAIAFAMVISLGSAFAQTSGSAQPSGTGGAGTSATGGRSAPAAQPGEGTRKSESTKDDKVSKADRKFIETAAGSGMFEVQVAQLATTRAKSPDVKSFAGMLVDHHTKANDELTQLANAKGVELPAAPPRAMRRETEQLGKKNGDAFDKDFIKDVGIKAHQKDIKEFEKASKDVKDPEVKAWATKTLPVLKEHLAQAQKLQDGKGSGASMGSSGSSSGSTNATSGNPSSGNTGGGASTKAGGGNGANKTGS
jgi:putative membrane protein